MRFIPTVLSLAAAARLASAHATVYAIFVNGVDQGLGNSAAGYIRSPPNNSPITNVQSKDMTCNVNNTPAAKTIKVKSGDEVTFEWHHNNRDASDDIIDKSHVGPVLTYIAPTKSNGDGKVWVKLAEDGYDGSSTWAVDKLIKNRGKHSITVPDLAAGEYLLRPEIIALHEGDRPSGAQFYMECVQVEVTSAGSKTLPEGVAIPGAYSVTDPGVLFNVYSSGGGPYPKAAYPIPGPPVWDGASGGSPASETPEPETPEEPETPAPASTPVPTPAPTPSPVTPPTAPAPSTLVTSVRPSATPAPPTTPPTTTPPTTTPPAGSVAIYQQCGGKNFQGATACATGLVCKDWNPWYFQCIPASQA